MISELSLLSPRLSSKSSSSSESSSSSSSSSSESESSSSTPSALESLAMVSSLQPTIFYPLPPCLPPLVMDNVKEVKIGRLAIGPPAPRSSSSSLSSSSASYDCDVRTHIDIDETCDDDDHDIASPPPTPPPTPSTPSSSSSSSSSSVTCVTCMTPCNSPSATTASSHPSQPPRVLVNAHTTKIVTTPCSPTTVQKFKAFMERRYRNSTLEQDKRERRGQKELERQEAIRTSRELARQQRVNGISTFKVKSKVKSKVHIRFAKPISKSFLYQPY